MVLSSHSARAAFLAASIGLALTALSCEGRKQSAPAAKKAAPPSIAGTWQSGIEAADRQISRSLYRIDQTRDSVAIRLFSMKSPQGDEIVPGGMLFEASGGWKGDELRLHATYGIAGKDTCTFDLRGRMDLEGRLLLFFPADICGEKSLPYTRRLKRLEDEPE